MRMHAHPFVEEGRHAPHGRNLATALLEGAVQVMDSALKARGGEIPAVKLPASPLSEGVSMHARACKMVALATGLPFRNASINACMRMSCSSDS